MIQVGSEEAHINAGLLLEYFSTVLLNALEDLHIILYWDGKCIRTMERERAARSVDHSLKNCRNLLNDT
jgi:hypothetical protein